MKCDIIIPVWNNPEFTKACVEQLVKVTRYPYRLVIIDNASAEETKTYLEGLERKNKSVTLIRNEQNMGFVKAVNQGLKISDAPYVCVLNNDTLPGKGWLTEMIRFAEENQGVGLVNPLCKGHEEPHMTVDDYAGFVAARNKGKFMEMNQCQGYAMLIKRELIEKVGYLDEQFGMGGFDDTDYSIRALNAGYGSVCVHTSYVYHREHASFDAMGDRKALQREAEEKFFTKWPYHRRIMLTFSINKKTKNTEIKNMTESALFLARNLCWVNVLIFGKKIDFPVHQNIKVKFLNPLLTPFETGIRILERSFGTKSRKRYYAVIAGTRRFKSIFKFLCAAQGAKFFKTSFARFPEKIMHSVIPPIRGYEKCDIIMPIWDQHEVTKGSIKSIIKNTDTPYRLIIINNGKDAKTKAFIDELQKEKKIEITVVENSENIGWIKAVNQGIGLSDAPFLCFQNDDTIVTKGWLRKMIHTLSLCDDFGIINPAWEGKSKGVSPENYNEILEKKSRYTYAETDWCRGFSMVLKREVVQKIGKMDEVYGLGFYDDVDYSIRAKKAGFLTLRSLDTYVHHIRNITSSVVLKDGKLEALNNKNQKICYDKWGWPKKYLFLLDRKFKRDTKARAAAIAKILELTCARHRVDVLTSIKLEEPILHTNIRVKRKPALFVKRKRYDGIFDYNNMKEA